MKRRWSAKHKRHGLLVIALTDLGGRLVQTSAAHPARGSEITACRHDDLVGWLRGAGLAAIADLGFVGLDDEAGWRPRPGRRRGRPGPGTSRAAAVTHHGGVAEYKIDSNVGSSTEAVGVARGH